MTRNEFTKYLDKHGYDYEIKGDTVVVTHDGDVYLSSLTAMPANVSFNNGGYVDLNSLTTLPANVSFNNGGRVYAPKLEETK